jgi:hydroxyacylglutathione hydrolase
MPLSADVFEQYMNVENAYVIDTRKAEQFAAGFIPGSVNIGIDGDFAVWVGTLIPDIQLNILLVTEPGRAAEVVTRLARIGCDHTLGFLSGGFDAWKNEGKPVDTIQSMSAEVFVNAYHAGVLLDVRKESEFESEHFIGAVNKPLDFIDVNYTSLNPDETYYIHCAGGYRSMIYASILCTKGFKNIINLEGGFKALKATGKLVVTEYVCPKTLL